MYWLGIWFWLIFWITAIVKWRFIQIKSSATFDLLSLSWTWVRCGDMRSFFTSSQSGQGTEGTAVGLPGCHLWCLRHWGHQSNSSWEVRVSLSLVMPLWTVLDLHSYIIMHHLGFEVLLGMNRFMLDVLDCNVKRLLKGPQGSTWKSSWLEFFFHVVRCVYAEHR